MAEQNPFNRLHVEQSAVSPMSDLLDQMNLPPAVTGFLRKNKKVLWIVVGTIALVVTVVSLYGSYSQYKIDKAASALTAALGADEAERKKLLEDVAAEHGSTPSALWSRIELSHLAVRQGNLEDAALRLTGVNKELSKSDPLKPLVLTRLAAIEEERGNLETALSLYKELAAFESFSADAHEALGRVYEAQGNQASALEMYEKYLQLTAAADGGASADDRFRDIVQNRVNYLKK